MSGGGYFLSHDRGLYSRAATALVALGAVEATAALGGRVVQLRDTDDHLFTLYEMVAPGTGWDLYDEPLRAVDGVRVPDPRLMVACPFDCRWKDLLARLARVIAQTSEAPTWILDGDGVVWDAESVDPARVHL